MLPRASLRSVDQTSGAKSPLPCCLAACWLPVSLLCQLCVWWESASRRLVAAPAPAPGAVNRMAIWAGPANSVPSAATALSVGFLHRLHRLTVCCPTLIHPRRSTPLLTSNTRSSSYAHHTNLHPIFLPFLPHDIHSSFPPRRSTSPLDTVPLDSLTLRTPLPIFFDSHSVVAIS